MPRHLLPLSLVLATAGLLVLGAPAPVLAHAEAGHAGGFLSGVLHPVSGLDHVVAMVAVGLWGVVLGPPALWLLPVAFPLVMALGGLVGMLGVPIPGVEIGIAISGLAMGLMVLFEIRAPLALAALIVAAFAVFHGHAHGTELLSGGDALLYSLGFVIATGMLHVTGILIGEARRWRGGRAVARGAGAAIALAGLLFLQKALA